MPHASRPPCTFLPALSIVSTHLFFSLWSFWRQESILISLTLLPSLRPNLIKVLRGCLLAVKVSINLKEKWYDGEDQSLWNQDDLASSSSSNIPNSVNMAKMPEIL